MTALLERAMGAIRQLPEEEQDQLARALLAWALAPEAAAPEDIPEEDREAVEEGLAQARVGQFASSESTAAAFARFDG